MSKSFFLKRILFHTDCTSSCTCYFPLFPHGWIAWNCTSLIMISSFPISGSWWSTPYHSPTKHEVPSAILWELRSTSKQVLNFNLMLTNPIYFFPWWSIQGRGFFFPLLNLRVELVGKGRTEHFGFHEIILAKLGILLIWSFLLPRWQLTSKLSFL